MYLSMTCWKYTWNGCFRARESRKKFCSCDFPLFSVRRVISSDFFCLCDFPLFSVGRAISSDSSFWLIAMNWCHQSASPASLLSKQSTRDTTRLFSSGIWEKLSCDSSSCSPQSHNFHTPPDFSPDCNFFFICRGFERVGLFPHNGSVSNPEEIWPNFQDHIMRKRD